jgi:cell division protein FtsN
MARSEEFGQGRRARRPYDDQDSTDRRTQPTFSADPPTQGRRAGTSYAPQFDHYASQSAAESSRGTSYVAQPTPRSGRADPRHAQSGHGSGHGREAQGWGDQTYQSDPSEEAWAQSVRSSFGTRQRTVQPQQQSYDQNSGYGYDPQQGYGRGQRQGQETGYGYPETGGYSQPGQGGYQGYGQYGGYDGTQHGYYPQGEQGYAPQGGYDQYAQDYPQDYGDPAYQGDDQILANGEYVEAGTAPPAPTRSRRGLIVAGAFVAAVLIGGGLGFIYKMTSEASFVSNGEPPLLTAGEDPVKSVPEETAADDGSSKSIYDRLNGGDGESSEGTSTVTLGDSAESVEVPKSEEARVIETDPVVPGVAFADEVGTDGGDPTASVDGVAGGAIGDGASAGSEGQPKVRKVKVVNVTPGETIDAAGLGSSDVATDDGGGAGTEETSVPAPEAADSTLDGQALTETPKKKKTQTAAEQVAALADAETTQPKVAGYVVQASVANTEVEALGAFADMQQRFGGLLASSQPDIQKIDGNKGYRLRIGPPTSKQAASALCNKLKAAGHKDCFIRQY